MAAQVVVEMTADEADLFRAQQKLLAQQKKMNSGYSQGAREAKQLERAAKKIYESTRTPAEQHIGRLRQLKDTLKSGKIDQETFNRAVEQSRDKFRQVTGTLSKQEVQARKTAEANKVMTQKQAEAAAKLSREQAEAAARQSAAARKHEQEQPLPRHCSSRPAYANFQLSRPDFR